MVKINVFNINQSQLAKHALKNSIACSDEYALLRSKLETLLRYLKKNSYWGLWQNVEIILNAIPRKSRLTQFLGALIELGLAASAKISTRLSITCKAEIIIQGHIENGLNEQQLPLV